MRLSRYTEPTAEPLHLTEAKIHLRLAVDASSAASYTAEDDSVLTPAISQIRHAAETVTWKACCLQTWDMYLDTWPISNEIELQLPPLREVVFIKYTDTDDNETTFTDYSVDTVSTPGRIVLDYGESWPSDTLRPRNPIQIRFKTGYLVPFTAAADTDIITGIDHPFSDGDKVRLSQSGGALPAGLAALTDYYVISVSGDTFQLSTTSGGSAIDLTDAGTGSMFVGVLPQSTYAGMKLILTDLYEERADTVVGRSQAALPKPLPRAAAHWFAMDSARRF